MLLDELIREARRFPGLELKSCRQQSRITPTPVIQTQPERLKDVRGSFLKFPERCPSPVQLLAAGESAPGKGRAGKDLPGEAEGVPSRGASEQETICG